MTGHLHPELLAALTGVPLSDPEVAALKWLMDRDEWVLDALAGLFRKARQCGPPRKKAW